MPVHGAVRRAGPVVKVAATPLLLVQNEFQRSLTLSYRAARDPEDGPPPSERARPSW